MSDERPHRKQGMPRVGSDGTVFKCPMCKTILPGTEVPSFPFCSERCRLLDLGAWLDGKYTISRPVDPTDHGEGGGAEGSGPGR